MNDREEVEPWLVCRVRDGQFECAVWRLEQGQLALALFLTEQSAAEYRRTVLSDAWQTRKPGREELLAILEESGRAGIELVALDPSTTEALRLFRIADVLRNSREESGGDQPAASG